MFVRREAPITLLFTDIEGSTRLWDVDSDMMSVALARHDQLVRRAIETAGGSVFKTVGDGFCAAFAQPAAALRAAIEIQRGLLSVVGPGGTAIRVRAGLHSGTCEFRDGDYFGPVVNRVARLQAIAHGGQVLLSRPTAELLGDQTPDGVELLDLGEHRLKDLQSPEWVFQVQADGLPKTFPPLRSLGNPILRHNLREQVSSFLGRERELVDIRSLLDEARLVTLTGAGGVGKTRLALQAGAELLDGTGDGVWFIDLAPVVDGELVALTAARAVGVHEAPGSRVLETLVEELRARNMLLVLDNCEHVIEHAARVTAALLDRCPDVVVLATSREPLRIPGERVYRVPSLAVPAAGAAPDEVARSPAVQLFLERARERGGDSGLAEHHADHVVAVCRRLDGIPLALELAAARLGSLGIRDLESRLDQRFSLLKGGDRVGLPRQQTLRALLDWSYNLASPQEQEVLRRASVFHGGFDLEATEAVCASADLGDDDVLGVLAALVEKSLVQAQEIDGAVRHRLLESVREYAADKLADIGEEQEEASRRRHRDHYLALAERAASRLNGAEQIEWLGRLKLEHDNLRVALTYSLHDPDPEPGLRLALALREFWRSSGYDVEGAELLAVQLDRPLASSPTLLRGRVLAAAAHLLSNFDYSAAVARGEEALEIASAHGDPRLTADSLCRISSALVFSGESERAVPDLERALALARQLGDLDLVASCLMVQGHANLRLDRDASCPWREALEIFEQRTDRLRAAVAAGNIGYLALSEGRYREARMRLEDQLAVMQEQDQGTDVLLTQVNVGLAAHLEGDQLAARSKFSEALQGARASRCRPVLAYALLGLALTMPVEFASDAASLHGAADAMFADLGQSPDVAESRARERSQAELRARLSNQRFDSAYRAGKRMTLEEAITLAMEPIAVAAAPVGNRSTT